jgi:hypothetical protein
MTTKQVARRQTQFRGKKRSVSDSVNVRSSQATMSGVLSLQTTMSGVLVPLLFELG